MTEQPFLPPDEPSDNPGPSQGSSTVRTVVLWVILIVMFIVIYNLFIPEGESTSTTRSVVSDLGDWLGRWWPLLASGSIIGLLWWQLRGAARFNRAQEPGLIALADGKYDTARATFEQVAARFKGQTCFTALARYNAAVAQLEQGDLDGAAQTLRDVDRTVTLPYASDVRLLTAISLAEVYARAGDTDAAEKWIEDARRRLARNANRVMAAARISMVTAIVHCRKGELDEALRLLERDWTRLEYSLTATSMADAWLIRAFAVGATASPRDYGTADAWVRQWRGVRRAQTKALTANWPELRAFVESVGVSTDAPRS